MKNTFRTLTTGILFASLLLQAQPGFAQNTVGVPLSGEPVPTTTTGGGANTTGTTVPGGTTSTTGTTTGTRTPGSTTTGTTTGTRTPGSTTTTIVPTPTDIPVVPSLTQEEGTPADGSDSNLVCNQERCVAAVGQAMGNEIIVMTILFLGSLIGGILWILGLLTMKKGVVERESRRMDRQNRFHLQKMLTGQKMKAYDGYINAVMSAIDKIQHKKGLDKHDLENFREGATFIELHGSKHLRAMNEHITALIGGGKPLATADRLHLKSELSKTIKADLLA